MLALLTISVHLRVSLEQYFPANCAPAYTGFNPSETQNRSQCTALRNGFRPRGPGGKPGDYGESDPSQPTDWHHRNTGQHYDLRESR